MATEPLSSHERYALEQRLPDEPLQADPATTEIIRYEVVVAYNLDPPYRYAQEFFWLEVLAMNERSAIEATEQWVLEIGDNFEATDLIRQASHHERTLGHGQNGRPLEIAWNLPVLAEYPNWQPLRSPISGMRIGFIGNETAEMRWLAPEAIDRFRIVLRKPTEDSEPLFLAPIVRHGREVGPR